MSLWIPLWHEKLAQLLNKPLWIVDMTWCLCSEGRLSYHGRNATHLEPQIWGREFCELVFYQRIFVFCINKKLLLTIITKQ